MNGTGNVKQRILCMRIEREKSAILIPNSTRDSTNRLKLKTNAAV